MPPQAVRVTAADSSEPSDSSDANLRQDIGHHDVLGIILDQLVLHETVMAEFLTTKIQFYPGYVYCFQSYIQIIKQSLTTYVRNSNHCF